MSGADAPEILAAYDAVRSNTDSRNWLLISYASTTGDKLQLTKTGSGGLEELKTELDDSQAQYAYLRIEYANDSEPPSKSRLKRKFSMSFSQYEFGNPNIEIRKKRRPSIAESSRTKFVLIIWIGENTKVMRKARVSIESGNVKRVLTHHSFCVDAREKKDLVEDEIVVRLRKAGGADYNGGRG